MISRILVACRGEIALRIVRAARECGVETVVAHSQADANSLAAQLANYKICIGPNTAKDSYLNIDAMLNAAHIYDCSAVYPGYGFLSESAQFARKCKEDGLIFIGPSAEVIEEMGSKSQARENAEKAGVPVVPGSDGVLKNAQEGLEVAKRVGYPVLIKAVSGGGGRGMRACHNDEELLKNFETASAEAKACFNDDRLYLEKLIINPKHIEFQIIGDTHGNVVHLGERDCSIQRNHQKMIEETPSKAISPDLREEMGMHAVALAKSVGYTGAGTIEYVLDSNGAKDGNPPKFYFIEMNTRIQVEHPITEEVYGVNLVREQLRIASGLRLSVKQEEVVPRGHAIECRINAEDPAKNFRPSPGKTPFVHFPGGCGIRVDSALYSGGEISPYYDSLAAKIITFAPTRLEAIRKMRSALFEVHVDNIPTTCELLYGITWHPDFLKGKYDTSFIAKNMDDILMWLDITDAADAQAAKSTTAISASASECALLGNADMSRQAD